ncbi:hypothetical protein [Nocardia jejuensis]|uniref:hypothetical protein n=1 Tax=Nocardia jejuensis TaxID=328049 RepID=UPI0008372D87|nr:hypothetical protein [Nocardia jejuensis]
MTAIIVVLVVIVAAAVIAFVMLPQMRSRKLRDTFGTEYDRAVQESDSRREAERELAERKRRHEELPLRELPAEDKRRYEMQWSHVQEQFIDDPAGALNAADQLLTQVMRERGYPTESFDQQVADLSVEHAGPLDRFRAAHGTAQRAGRGEVSTEDMRTALVNYRELVLDVLGNGHSEQSSPDRTPTPDRAETAPERVQSPVSDRSQVSDLDIRPEAAAHDRTDGTAGRTENIPADYIEPGRNRTEPATHNK